MSSKKWGIPPMPGFRPRLCPAHTSAGLFHQEGEQRFQTAESDALVGVCALHRGPPGEPVLYLHPPQAQHVGQVARGFVARRLAWGRIGMAGALEVTIASG